MPRAREGGVLQPFVNVLAVADVNDAYDQLVILNGVDDPKVSRSDAVQALHAFELLLSVGPWIGFQREQLLVDLPSDIPGELAEGLGGAVREANFVGRASGHLRPSICLRA